MTLERYLLDRIGQPVENLKVIGANGCPGIVKKVEWNTFPGLPDTIDVERSWVFIEWEGRRSDCNSVDFMMYVTVAEDQHGSL